ncbi:Cysteine proteinase [Pleurostoma richardsiae]|uniref:Ubiquitin carboxyl-terminal hydrolase n=1 Tax=Pleurostoma richardsiae TaxID=41990 RepID=A0AA38RQY7_9PEZI|nr:Cysteine proteinase [Pleurostoma richardsiae]
MSNRHLPAGQAAMPGGPGVEMVPGPGMGGPRRGNRPPQYPAQYHHQPVGPPMYANYMPYGPYYPPMPPPYQNGGIPSPGYMPYQPYSRSPPTMQQYVPMPMSPSMPQPPYSRPPQSLSPVVSTPYQPPPLPPTHIPVLGPAPVPPLTPSSTHSSQIIPPPPITSPPPQTPEAVQQPIHIQPQPDVLSPSTPREPFRPPLPWFSRPNDSFPARIMKSRRRRRVLATDAKLELPVTQHEGAADLAAEAESQQAAAASSVATSIFTEEPASATTPKSVPAQHAGESVAPPTRSETPSTQEHPSEDTTSTSPTTPGSVHPPSSTTAATPTPTKPSKPAVRTAIPAIPIVPIMPRPTVRDVKPNSAADKTNEVDKSSTEQGIKDAQVPAVPTNGVPAQEEVKEEAPKPAGQSVKPTPKTWSGLFAGASPITGAAAGAGAGHGSVNGSHDTSAVGNGNAIASGFAKSNASSLAEALRLYRVGSGEKIAFLEPRGLINTGNMCYMNSVLQVLLFCIPFYDFLDQVGKKAVHNFKSETPLVDAMILFMREFKIIDSAVSAEQLRRRLKNEELEQYGEPFTPEFVYDAIRQLPRFASMRRGHQQDAEEFLGFLLEALHDECAHVMRTAPESGTSTAASSTPAQSSASVASETAEANDWLEVGRRQRAAVTRSSGQTSTSSPITKIFGGQLRSELRVPGLKDSVTLEPYQPLQLDIQGSNIRNIIDALKGLTKPETLHGDFGSPRGKDVVATKQMYIESLPPVLILHLKRFQFDAEGNGTVKIWKKIGYPLELEIPREVFSRQKRNSVLAEGAGLPKYRLISVVYHHGKNASGGHYTVDLRRQDGREWIRMDDTVLRRVRSEDVADGGAEEEPSKFTDDKKESGVAGVSGNRFAGMGEDDAGEGEDGWKQVTATANGGKKWSSVVNGSSSGSSTPKGKPVKDNIKDNKVAYLLFYQRM